MFFKSKKRTNVAALAKVLASGFTTFDPSYLGVHNTLSNGNLTVTGLGGGPGSQYDIARSIASHSSGKYYFELDVIQSPNGSDDCFGICTSGLIASGVGSGPGFDGTGLDITVFTRNANIWYNSGQIGSLAQSPLPGDIIGIAFDADNKLLWINDIVSGTTPGTWNNTSVITPASGLGGISISGLTSALYAYFALDNGQIGAEGTANFGASTYAIVSAGRSTDITGFGNM